MRSSVYKSNKRMKGRSQYQKKWGGKRRVTMRGPRPSEFVTLVKTKLIEDAIGTNSLSVNTGFLEFRADQISDWGTLRSVYDQYRIESVDVTFVPKMNTVGGVATAAGTSVFTPQMCGIFATALDYDSNTVPSAMINVLEYGNAKWTRGTSLHRRVFKPKANLMSVLPGTSTSTAVFPPNNGKNPWLSTEGAVGPAVPHYGIRYAVEDSDGMQIVYDIIVKFKISLKCTH